MDKRNEFGGDTMQVGDLVKYIWYGHDETADVLGIIINIDENGCYEVHFADGEVLSDLVYSELEVVCK